MMNSYGLGTLLFLLSEPQGLEGEPSYLDHLKSHTGKVTDGSARPPHPSNQTTVVIVNQFQGTIPRNEGDYDFVVLLELDTNCLTNSGVWLLGFDGDLANDDTGGHGDAFKRGFVDRRALAFAEGLHCPEIVPVCGAQFSGGLAAAGFGLPHAKGRTKPPGSEIYKLFENMNLVLCVQWTLSTSNRQVHLKPAKSEESQ
jgi:hypothetical protein